MKNSMKKLYLTLGCAVGSAFSVLAEGGSGATIDPMDSQTAENIVKASTDGLKELLEACAPYVATIILAGLAIWAGMVIIKVVKRAFSRAG